MQVMMYEESRQVYVIAKSVSLLLVVKSTIRLIVV
jgi:hypothetical protein